MNLASLAVRMSGAHTRTLQRALKIVQSKERLAAALQIPVPELEAYLAGRTELPQPLFLLALDIVAGSSRNTR
jgi:hypothetical protein